MGLFDKILSVVGGPITGFVETVFGGIDALSTTEEEKLKVKQEIMLAQQAFTLKMAELQSELAEEQASVIKAEINSESWLTRSWRPLTMLGFVVLLFLYWFGVQPASLAPETLNEIFGIVKVGIGGYVVSRGAEKVVHNWKNGASN